MTKLTDVLNLDSKALEKKAADKRSHLKKSIDAIRVGAKDANLATTEKDFWGKVEKELNRIEKDLKFMLLSKSFKTAANTIRQLAEAVNGKITDPRFKIPAPQDRPPKQNAPDTQPKELDEQELKTRKEKATKIVEELRKVPDGDLTPVLDIIEQSLITVKTDTEMDKIDRWLISLNKSYEHRIPSTVTEWGLLLEKKNKLQKEYDGLIKTEIPAAKKDYPSRLSAFIATEKNFKSAMIGVGPVNIPESTKTLDFAEKQVAELKRLTEAPKYPAQNVFEPAVGEMKSVVEQFDKMVKELPAKIKTTFDKEEDRDQLVGTVEKSLQKTAAPYRSLESLIKETKSLYDKQPFSKDVEAQIDRNVASAKASLKSCTDELTSNAVLKDWDANPFAAAPQAAATIKSALDKVDTALKG